MDGMPEEVIVESLQELQLGESSGTRKLHRGSRRPRASKEGDVTTSMPGNIIEVLVNEGDAVKAGDPVIITEAMKMETEIQAPISGTVTAIHIGKGDNVNPDEALIEIEPG
jgi:pyruvate carboxylase subunit B